ncbi:MAG TPA: putative lipid II flippase FtsW [Acidimicrobiales bacterium]|nr:putative lipid II flippase FtsW [Acidimicrobiales bacterium]
MTTAIGDSRRGSRSRARARTGTRPAPASSGPAGDRGFVMLVAIVLVMNLFGLVMVLSASSVTSLTDNGDSWSYFNRQLVWVALGTVAMVTTMNIDYRLWPRISWFVYGAVLALLVAVLAVGVNVNGSTRWIVAGPLRLQPSELAKIATVLAVATLLADREHCLGDRRRSIHTTIVVMAPLMLLILAEPDLGTTLIIAMVAATMLFAAGVPLRPLGGFAGLGLLAAGLLARLAPYRYRRIVAFRDPWADPRGVGWQPLNSLAGLANGGSSGVGLGESRVKWGWLANSHTDFIYAIIGEELGLIGTMAVLAMVALIGFLGLRAAYRAPDLLGRMLATGVTMWLLVQAFVNIGGVVGLLPITGVTLPFVSFGGSSLLVTMAATGILLNVARRGRPVVRARAVPESHG